MSNAIIREVTVYDGIGAEPFIADAGLEEDRITLPSISKKGKEINGHRLG